MNRFNWFFTHIVYAIWSLFVRGENVHVVVLTCGPESRNAARVLLEKAVEEISE